MGSRLILCLLTGLLASCLQSPAEFLAERGTRPDQNERNSETLLEIYALQAGQGDATLLRGADGTTALIDAGPPFSGITHLLPQLRSLGVEELDWVLLSHYDADHLGGLLEILKGEDQEWDTTDDIPLRGPVWDRSGEPFDPTFWYKHYATVTEERGWRESVMVGQSLPLGPGVAVTIVLANGEYEDGSVIHLNPNEENSASIALLIEQGDFRYLTAGDLTGGGWSGNLETRDLETRLAEQVKLEVIEKEHVLDEADLKCRSCGKPLQEWEGQSVDSEEIEVIERRFIRVKHRRKKYRCPCGGCVEVAIGPRKLIPGGRYSQDFAVHVAVAKYADHLPLERQVRMMRRQGLDVTSQALCPSQNVCHKQTF